MNWIAQCFGALTITMALASCNQPASPPAATSNVASPIALGAATPTAPTAAASMLDAISGVWRASDGTMVSIVYEEKKLRVLFGTDVIPVQLGEIDEVNHTANLKVILKDGKPGIWTVSQVFDSSDKNAFTLQFTLQDGTQDQLSFVRKISNDDLSVIAAAESKVHAGSISEAVAQPQEQQFNSEVSSAAGQDQSIPADTQAGSNVTWTPSFDCTKASTGPERLICSSKELSAADIVLAQAYRSARNASADKAMLEEQQATWRKTVRDACSDVQCMLGAYQQRMSELH